MVVYNGIFDVFFAVGMIKLPMIWDDLPLTWRPCNRHCHGSCDSLTGMPAFHDDVIKWKHLPRNWPFVRGIHWSPVNSPLKGQWRGSLRFSLICTRINGWVNNHEGGDLRRHRAHYGVIVMLLKFSGLESNGYPLDCLFLIAHKQKWDTLAQRQSNRADDGCTVDWWYSVLYFSQFIWTLTSILSLIRHFVLSFLSCDCIMMRLNLFGPKWSIKYYYYY